MKVDLLAKKLVVIFMAANPKPEQPIRYLDSNGAIMKSDPNRPIAANLFHV